jgi:hypothetical protein
VRSVDGRMIGNAHAAERPMMERLRGLYKALAKRSLTPIAGQGS